MNESSIIMNCIIKIYIWLEFKGVYRYYAFIEKKNRKKRKKYLVEFKGVYRDCVTPFFYIVPNIRCSYTV